MVPSEFTRNELARIRVPARRVTVIGHAPAPRLATHDRPAAEAVMARHGLRPDQYVLTVGTLEPRKNIIRLVAAFERGAVSRPVLRLVLVGAPGWHYAPILARIEASSCRDRIVFSATSTRLIWTC